MSENIVLCSVKGCERAGASRANVSDETARINVGTVPACGKHFACLYHPSELKDGVKIEWTGKPNVTEG